MIVHTFDANGRELSAEELASMQIASPEIQNIYGEVIFRILDSEEESCECSAG